METIDTEVAFREGHLATQNTPPPGRAGRGLGERPPRRLDISRRGRGRAAPGLKLGAYVGRRPRQGPPAVATESPLPAREWRGVMELFYGESA